jgi:hypothetical protein
MPAELTQAVPVIATDAPAARHRRPCIPPASPLHAPGGLPADIDRPTVQRRAEAAARSPRDVDLRQVADDLASMLRGDDAQARLHQARNIVTSIALLAAHPGEQASTRIGGATTTIHRAILDGGADHSTAAHFARLAIDALVADGHL